MANYSSRQNQSVYDVCLMTYTDLNLMYKLLQDSNFDNVQTYPKPETIFIFEPTLIADRQFAAYVSKSDITLGTAPVSDEDKNIGGSYDDSYDDSYD